MAARRGQINTGARCPVFITRYPVFIIGQWSLQRADSGQSAKVDKASVAHTRNWPDGYVLSGTGVIM